MNWAPLLVAAVCVLSPTASTAVKLTSFNFNIAADSITTSGVSAGGYMAVQFHVAHSRYVKGSASFAAGPWFCAQDSLVFAEEKCMKNLHGGPNTRYLADLTVSEAALGAVDSPLLMRDHPVFIYSGTLDTVISPAVVQELETYYSYFIDKENIVTSYDLHAEHSMPTLLSGAPCEQLGEPYLGRCDFDGAGAALKTLYGTGLTRGSSVTSNLFEFDQRPYFGAKWASLDDVGYIYVPTACSDGSTKCKLHVSFHGCLQTRELIGDAYAREAGYNEWAEASNIVVVYPYAKASPVNPNGCFDWWGYTNAMYALKTGLQISFAERIILEITAGRV